MGRAAGGGGRWPAAVPAEIRRLPAWLLERRVGVVVLEATSGYWRHVYCTLQPQLNLMPVDPAHLGGRG
ncbi:hypothetical protein DIZ27_30540 [Streptomyces sp. NWU339]|uniref:hypothetical protein n=1 Tax=Streptomyces sp. NWU339 TaxID=2185284 RepID=UPI000D6845B6|nr:hypothetical protein [Streptomyces sp. NWU339]PWI06931.1 hypothetical protein DIZ27_30540 [Streptomyces sp. NWU339]